MVILNGFGQLVDIVGGAMVVVSGFAENTNGSFSHSWRVAESGDDLFNRVDLLLGDDPVGLCHFRQTSEKSDLN